MSLLFTPFQIRAMEVKNRFVHSATYECMADETGEVTDDLLKRYRSLAKGEIGLIIPGHMYVHPLGRGMKNQVGIHRHDMIPGLKRLADAVHQESGKIAFQLAHAGLQTEKNVTGQRPPRRRQIKSGIPPRFKNRRR
jgi:2,4-dienoyl-CoA reductase-like NADH-dependent reductase (Old Yellow Enzyme family)